MALLRIEQSRTGSLTGRLISARLPRIQFSDLETGAGDDHAPMDRFDRYILTSTTVEIGVLPLKVMPHRIQMGSLNRPVG